MSRLHQEELVFFRFLSLLTLSPENKHDLLVDNSTLEHVLFSSASKLLLLLQRDHEKLSKLCVIICTGNNVGMSSQGIWSFLPMTRWNMLGSVSFHQVKLQYWWTGWDVLSTASTPSGSSSRCHVAFIWYIKVLAPLGGWMVGRTGRSGVEKGREEKSAACCTFSICHESGAAHYHRVLSTELTWKDKKCVRRHGFEKIHI